MESWSREWARYVPRESRLDSVFREYFVHIPSGVVHYQPRMSEFTSIHNNRPEGGLAYIVAHGWMRDPTDIPLHVQLPVGI